MKWITLHNVESAVQILKVVAHPVRLRILVLLTQEKRLSVGNIHTQLKEVQSTISQHLSFLRNVGVVACDKANNVRYYYIANKSIYRLLDCIDSCVKT